MRYRNCRFALISGSKVGISLSILALLFAAGCRERVSDKVPTPPLPSASTTPESPRREEAEAFKSCAEAVLVGFRKIAPVRDVRFQAKVSDANALCRGGYRAMQFRNTPWVDWSNYWGTGDESSFPKGFISNQLVARRGVLGALLDLEYQRIELIKFNLFDNSGTFQQFISGRDGTSGQAIKVWPEMRLKPDHPEFTAAGGSGTQICKGDLVRWRTVDGICNDVVNPAMGSNGQLFARNVEFRRQYGLRQLTSFDDFIDHSLPSDSPARLEQEQTVKAMREIYGQHECDSSKVITDAQRNQDKSPINDCLGHPNGTLIDNIEDVDTIVGYLAEPVRPHGFAISETQFVVFILNASRRLFSDRFFTSCFRPEFYTRLGVDWVNHNGPGPVMIEPGMPNGHKQPVSPMKRVLLRNIPELKVELDSVVNAFDPWARDRNRYYDLQWKARPGAESDDAFPQR